MNMGPCSEGDDYSDYREVFFLIAYNRNLKYLLTIMDLVGKIFPKIL